MNVVITGGSRGIGAAAVRLFARRGDRVWFLYEKNDEAARAVAAETGALPIRCDVADEVRVTDALSAIPALGVVGIWWSVPIGWFLADAAGLFYYLSRKKQLYALPKRAD